MRLLSWIRAYAVPLLAAGFVALLLNSAYLAAFATPSLF